MPVTISNVQIDLGLQNGGDTTVPISYTSAPTEGNLLLINFW